VFSVCSGEPRYPCMMNDDVTDLERVSSGRRRDVWGSPGTFYPTVRTRVVERLTQLQLMMSVGCRMLCTTFPQNEGRVKENLPRCASGSLHAKGVLRVHNSGNGMVESSIAAHLRRLTTDLEHFDRSGLDPIGLTRCDHDWSGIK